MPGFGLASYSLLDVWTSYVAPLSLSLPRVERNDGGACPVGLLWGRSGLLRRAKLSQHSVSCWFAVLVGTVSSARRAQNEIAENRVFSRNITIKRKEVIMTGFCISWFLPKAPSTHINTC